MADQPGVRSGLAQWRIVLDKVKTFFVPLLQNLSVGVFLSGLFYLLLSRHDDPVALYNAVVALPLSGFIVGLAIWLHWR